MVGRGLLAELYEIQLVEGSMVYTGLRSVAVKLKSLLKIIKHL